MSPLRAALRAYVTLGGPPGTDGAWQEALTKIRRAEAKRQRHLYLDPADRRTLLASTCDEASPFFRALAMLPIRPGAMSDLTVASFSPKTGKLQVGWDKGHPPRIVRITAPETLALFIAQTKGKTPAAPLFSRANGDKWTAYWWKFPMRDAREAAGLPEETIAYTLRHCVITDMVKHGAPTLAIAKMAGTSVEMIEEYYAHELDSAAQEALAAVAAAI
jgi:site-specific recombinase XerD